MNKAAHAELHYENVPMQFAEIFFSCKTCKFPEEKKKRKKDVFNIFAQSI